MSMATRKALSFGGRPQEAAFQLQKCLELHYDLLKPTSRFKYENQRLQGESRGKKNESSETENDADLSVEYWRSPGIGRLKK